MKEVILRFSGADADIIESFAEKANMPIEMLVAKSLITEAAVLDALRQGLKLVVASKDGELRELKINS